MRRLGIALVVLTVVTAVVSVSASGGSGAQSTSTTATLTATGSGSVTFTPDSATLSFGASTQKPTAAGAITADATAMNAIIDALKQAGVTDVSTDAVSLSIRYNPNQTAITGFQATNAVQGSIAVDHVGTVIDAAVAAGATSINGPSFSSTQDQESLYRAALRNAIAQARQRAGVIAEAAGVTLGKIVSIEPSSSSGVVATPTSASPSTPVLAPTQEVTASVTLVFTVS